MIQLTFTDLARQKVRSFMEAQQKPGILIRISIPNSSPQGFNYQFFIDEEKNLQPNDIVIDCGEFKTVVDSISAKNLNGAEIGWMDSVQGSGFKVDNPNKPEINFEVPAEERIQNLFDEEINPMLASHSGHVELIEIEGPRAYVRLSGGCQGCSSSAATLKQGIETRIKDIAPEILEVIDTTDHAAGTNPYFQSA